MTSFDSVCVGAKQIHEGTSNISRNLKNEHLFVYNGEIWTAIYTLGSSVVEVEKLVMTKEELLNPRPIQF